MSRAKRLRKASATRKRQRALARFLRALERVFDPGSIEFKVAREIFWRDPWPKAARQRWYRAVYAGTKESKRT